MMLERKNAVIYGGGGNVGGAVARARSPVRARPCTSPAARWPRSIGSPRPIRDDGGSATVAAVDALDEAAVDAHADALVRDHGTSTSR